jgi:hypothetical protein
MLVYETERFVQQAHDLGVGGKVDELRASVAAASTVAEVRQHFDALVPYYKDRSGKVRIIARMHRVIGHDVFCFLGAFERKSGEYKEFLWDRRRFGSKHLEAGLDLQQLEGWVRRQLASAHTDSIQAEPLPEEMWGWLDPPREAVVGLDGDGEVQVYESRRWVEDIGGRRFQQSLLRFYDLVQTAAQEPSAGRLLSDVGAVEIWSKTGHSILVRQFAAGPGSARSVFLVAPFLRRPTDTEIKAAVIASGLLASDDLDVDAIARRSRRTYPSYLLADEDAWRAIETDLAANLALSGEEESLLLSVAGSGPDSGLPLLINGRAGSGKSTMLSYLFGAFCLRRGRDDLAGRPLFLTYSDRLLATSRAAVTSLLAASHELVVGEPVVAERTLAEWFSPFRHYLLARLPPERRADFPADRHVAFHHFRNAYLGKAGRLPALQLAERRKWTPELAWYVIRTFIKGYAAAGYLDPSLYGELPRAERVVSEETYSAIHDSIWERWYQKAATQLGAWDDQDLVLAVLTQAEELSEEPIMAIVCDEAQDFTRRELQLVIRSLRITDFDLSDRPIVSLPLVLAGDPLQTLNPTGFRWESIQAALHEELAIKIGEGRATVRLKQLENNYRSTTPIVEAVNGIQLWRSVLFGIKELRPQTAWDISAGSKPHKYIIGSNVSHDELARLVEDTIIIVPCDEGGEADFVRNDPVLSRIFPDVSEDSPARSVLSATSAKGCEFGRVIVWCFGDACPSTLFAESERDEQAQFEAEYFLNKLYVAASRAKHHLFVVDTLTGDAQLWSRGQPEALVALAERAHEPDLWRGLCRAIELAPVGASSELRETAIEETAVVLREQGLSARDPRLLRQASDFFRSVPDDEEVDRCEAWARRYEERLIEAGQLFAQIGDRHDAFDCFWEARSWSELREWYRGGVVDRSAHEERRALVEFMTGSRSTDDVVAYTAQLGHLIETNRLGSFLDPGWRDGVAAFLKSAAALAEVIPADEMASFAKVLAELGDRGFDGALKVAGSAFYRAGMLDRAVQCWEKAGHTRHFDYSQAKATAAGLPQGLEWLMRDGGSEGPAEVLRLWREQGRPTEPGWLRHIAPAQERSGVAEEAFDTYRALGDTTSQVRVYASLVGQSIGAARRALEPLALELASADELSRLVELLNHGDRFAAEQRRAAAGSVHRIVRSAADAFWHRTYTKPERDSLRKILKIASSGSWNTTVHPVVMGAGYELAGNYVDALKFYEGFTDDRDEIVRSASRRRWLKVKADQLAEAKERSKSWDMTRRERARRAHDWGLREDLSLEAHPVLPAECLGHLPTHPIAPSMPSERIPGIEIDRRGDDLILLDAVSSHFARVNLRSRRAATAEGDVEAADGFIRFGFPGDRLVEIDLTRHLIRVQDGALTVQQQLP